VSPRNRVQIRHASDGSQWISTRELTEDIFGSQGRTQADQTRRYFGSGVTPEVIESVIRMADLGYMRDLTDLTKEAMNFDPHLLCVVPKRFRALASITPTVKPAEGPGVDPNKAAMWAAEVKRQIAGIPNFKAKIINLNWGHCNGRAALEKTWRERRGGPIQFEIGSLNWIKTRRISLGPMREFRIRDDAFGGGAFEARGLDIESIPHKFIAYKPQLFDEDIEREGFGPRCLYWAFFKRFSWRERMILTEVFGSPWRIIEMDKDCRYTGPDELDDAQDRADEMGAHSSAALAPGMKLRLENADPKSVDFHDKTSDKCDEQMSKLVLGNTNTTDAKANGLGGQQSLVHQDGETLVIAADGWGMGDCLTECIARDIVELNGGEEELVNAPSIELAYKASPDQGAETEQLTKVFSLGIPLKVEEVYRRSGYEQPGPGDQVLTQQTTPSANPMQPGAKSVAPSTVPDEPTEGADAGLPLAASMSRSLRLSRLSKDYFSGR